MAATNSNAINYFSPAKWVVSKVAGEGTHTTIAGALAAASTGDTIFVMPGNYAESNTISTAVNIVGYTGDGYGNVSITGTMTVSSAITVYISNIELITPATTYFLTVSGSAASVVYLTNCNLDCSVATGIDYTSSSSSSSININFCTGNLGTTGIGLYTMSSAGTLYINYCKSFANSGGSTTASSNSAGAINIRDSLFFFPFSTSSSGSCSAFVSSIDTSAQNTTCLTTAGTGSQTWDKSTFNGGTASAISIGTGTTVQLLDCVVSSTNTNAITGAGTLDYGGLTFNETTTINTTTQNPIAWPVQQGGTGNTSTTAYALICGGTTTTGAFQAVADVATGQVLTSGGTSALPAFSAAPTVTSITFGTGSALSTFSQGTFSPTVRGSSTAGTVNMTVQVGRYQAVGRYVTISMNCQWTTLGGATGAVQVNNLPFTSNSTSNQTDISIISTGNVAFTTGSGGVPFFQLNNNASTGNVNYYLGSTGAGNATTITASNSFITTITYET